MKKLLLSGLGVMAIAHADFASALTIPAPDAQIGGSQGSIDTVIVALINFLALFVGLLAVLYAIFGGFTILTAAGDEEKVKKGRTIIFHALLGMIVIYLAYSIVTWVTNLLFAQVQ